MSFKLYTFATRFPVFTKQLLRHQAISLVKGYVCVCECVCVDMVVGMGIKNPLYTSLDTFISVSSKLIKFYHNKTNKKECVCDGQQSDIINVGTCIFGDVFYLCFSMFCTFITKLNFEHIYLHAATFTFKKLLKKKTDVLEEMCTQSNIFKVS